MGWVHINSLQASIHWKGSSQKMQFPEYGNYPKRRFPASDYSRNRHFLESELPIPRKDRSPKRKFLESTIFRSRHDSSPKRQPLVENSSYSELSSRGNVLFGVLSFRKIDPFGKFFTIYLHLMYSTSTIRHIMSEKQMAVRWHVRAKKLT